MGLHLWQSWTLSWSLGRDDLDLDWSTTEAIMAERMAENKLRKRDENIRILSAIIQGLSHGCLARYSIYIGHNILRSLDQSNKLA